LLNVPVGFHAQDTPFIADIEICSSLPAELEISAMLSDFKIVVASHSFWKILPTANS